MIADVRRTHEWAEAALAACGFGKTMGEAVEVILNVVSPELQTGEHHVSEAKSADHRGSYEERCKRMGWATDIGSGEDFVKAVTGRLERIVVEAAHRRTRGQAAGLRSAARLHVRRGRAPPLCGNGPVWSGPCVVRSLLSPRFGELL